MPAVRPSLTLVSLLVAGCAPLMALLFVRRLLARPRRCDGAHAWQPAASAAGWQCRRCGASRPECPHLSWEMSAAERVWRCRGCDRDRAFDAEGDAATIVSPLLEAHHA